MQCEQHYPDRRDYRDEDERECPVAITCRPELEGVCDRQDVGRQQKEQPTDSVDNP
jgi:hypothetical protein